MSSANFEDWYAACVLAAIDFDLAPNGYVWDIEHPDAQFRALFEQGAEPKDAVTLYFSSNTTQTRH